MHMQKRVFLRATMLAAAIMASGQSFAEGNTFKIGLILPMTGQQASTGRQIDAAVRLYMAQNGDTVGGKKIKIILKDDNSTPDVTKKIAQELVDTEQVDLIAGMGLTPSAMGVAPIVTKAKIPLVVMAAATSAVTDASPYIVRTSFTVPQAAVAMADWAPKNGIRRVITLVSDYGPGLDAEKFFKERFSSNGGNVLESLRVPLRDPDFLPMLQKIRDTRPDAMYAFVPAGAGSMLMKQFIDLGLNKVGIRLIGPGDLVDDDQINNMGDGALGVVTAHHMSAAHPSAVNKKFVDDFKRANNNMRPNFMAIGGYDGMRVIYEAVKATKGGQGGGDALVEAMKGLSFESPRGPIRVDPETRELIQNIYLRQVARVDGGMYNVEFDVIKDVKDPAKIKK